MPGHGESTMQVLLLQTTLPIQAYGPMHLLHILHLRSLHGITMVQHSNTQALMVPPMVGNSTAIRCHTEQRTTSRLIPTITTHVNRLGDTS